MEWIPEFYLMEMDNGLAKLTKAEQNYQLVQSKPKLCLKWFKFCSFRSKQYLLN